MNRAIYCGKYIIKLCKAGEWMKLIFLGSGGGRFRDHYSEANDRRI